MEEDTGNSVIDIEQLISLVFQRPALWDKRLKDHGNRYVIAKHWKEICKITKVEGMYIWVCIINIYIMQKY